MVSILNPGGYIWDEAALPTNGYWVENRVQLTGETRWKEGAEQVFCILVQQGMDQDLAGYREGTHTVLAVSRAGGSTQVLVPALIF